LIARLIAVLVALLLLVALYFAAAWNWSFSVGERAGWVQKISKKGWVCKTWEGELVLTSLPGSVPEKFLFTIHDEAVATQVNRLIGKRVALYYEEKVGLPTSCFGDTRYFITKVTQSDEIPLGPGLVVPTPPMPALPVAPAAPAASR